MVPLSRYQNTLLLALLIILAIFIAAKWYLVHST